MRGKRGREKRRKKEENEEEGGEKEEIQKSVNLFKKE